MRIQTIACTEQDWEQLLNISYQTFDETFRPDNTSENMEAYLSEAFTEEKIKNELNNPESEFHFIYFDDELAGYLKVNTGSAQTEQMGDESLEIERIYVLKIFQKQGIGKQLYNKALTIAKQYNLSKVWLGVWEHNQNAIEFYKKMGFKHISDHSFFMGDDRQTDIIMQKIL
jgi:ribosomal protein S18 acetylase RimI-like enzyme